MFIYKLTRTDEWSYDDYDMAVVAAESAEEAQKMDIPKLDQDIPVIDSWTTPENVSVLLIGVAADDVPAGLILASYNAG